MRIALFAAAAIVSAGILSLQKLGAAEVSQSGAFMAPAAAGRSNPAVDAPRYEWRYHYVGRHGRMEGYWAPVK
jgi:hypothetical protein